MITSTIGKIFLDAYNKKFGTDYDAKTFFVEVYYPLFFDDNKYLMTAGNTPFENGPKISWPKMIKGNKPFETVSERRSRFDKFLEKVEIGYPTTDNAIGYASSDIISTTSGQTTNIQFPFSKDEIYFSWIGAGLNVRASGLLILFFEKQILLDIFDGWKYYRDMLNHDNLLKGNQIESWNGQWLLFKYSEDDVETLYQSISHEKCTGDYTGCTQLTYVSWSRLMIAICKHYPNPKMQGYVFDLGQTNTSIGFMPFNLDHIRRPLNFYEKYFGINEGKKAEMLWGTENGFRTCCQKGAIGIEAMQPKNLTKYMNSKKLPKWEQDNEDQTILFHTYQIWLLAMLNNNDLWTKAENFSAILHKYSASPDRGKKEMNQMIEDILSTKSRMKFLDALTVLIPTMELNDKNTTKEIGVIVNEMPAENVLYFLTLIKFNYSLIKS